MCKQWYDIVVSCPHLWQDIYSTGQTTDHLHIPTIVRLSKALPLRIGYEDTTGGMDSDDLFQALSLSDTPNRISSFSYISTAPLQTKAQQLLELSLPQLADLEIVDSSPIPDEEGPAGVETRIDLKAGPPLRRVSLDRNWALWDSPRLSDLRSLSLTNLKQGRSPLPSQIYGILASSPRLQDLRLGGLQLTPDQVAQGWDILPPLRLLAVEVLVMGHLSEPIWQMALSCTCPSLYSLATYFMPSAYLPLLDPFSITVIHRIMNSNLGSITVDPRAYTLTLMPDQNAVGNDVFRHTQSNIGIVSIAESYDQLNDTLINISELLSSVNPCPPLSLKLADLNPEAHLESSGPSTPFIISPKILLPSICHLEVGAEAPVDRKALLELLATPPGQGSSWLCPNLEELNFGGYTDDVIVDFVEGRWGRCGEPTGLTGSARPRKLEKLISGLEDEAVINHATGKCSCTS